MTLKCIFILLFYCYIGVHGDVRLQSSGPTVLGANLTLSAILDDDYAGVQHKFVFRNVEKNETMEILSSSTVVNYTVKISRDKYDVGLYAFEVRVYRRTRNRRRPYSLASHDRLRVPVTDLLNGKLKLIQNGNDRSNGRIYPHEPVNHIIELSQEELQFLTDDNTYIVHWYIDCSLISYTGLSFDYTYEDAHRTYNLEALVEVQHNKLSNGTPSSRPDGLSGFTCSPVHSSGYTYGYYKASVRTDAAGGSPRPPTSGSSATPSNTWQGSSSTDSTTGRSTGAVNHSGGTQDRVKLQSSGPVVRGAELTLSATFLNTYEYLRVERKYVFLNVAKQETVEILSKESVVNYTLKLNKDTYKAGDYGFEVRVYERNVFDIESFVYLCSDRITVSVTELLNGKLKLIQNGLDKTYGRVFRNELVTHTIELSQEEQKFLTDDNTYIVHWYIDCSLISYTGLSFDYTYGSADHTYTLEALVEVEHNPSSSARRVKSRSSDSLSGFKCAPISDTGYTYGYYKASVRADATDSSPRPPPRTATSENPSSSRQDSTTGRSSDAVVSGGTQDRVKLQSSGPVVRGAELTLSATFLNTYEYLRVERKYVFLNVAKQETVEILSKESVVNYTLKLNKDAYEAGDYDFEVRVYERNVFDIESFVYLCSDRITVSVTELLNGKLKLIQNGLDKTYGRVFRNELVTHTIELSQEEQKFLTDDNTYIVLWYIDCSLIAVTGLSFGYTYGSADHTYTLEALVEVEHNPSSSARRVISRKSDRLSGFKCAQISNSGYTYGYYNASVRADATDSSPRPPPRTATSENPSSSWQDSISSDSSTRRSTDADILSGGDQGRVKLRSSGPTVRGAKLTLSANFVDSYLRVERKYVFRNVAKQETVEILSKEPVVNYTLKLNKDAYDAGDYAFEVRVYERNVYDNESFRYLSSDRISVPVTERLNGKLKLIQNGIDRSYGRVFPNERVSHIIELSQEELEFLTDDNTYLVYWYIDCSLISSTGLHVDHTYKDRQRTYTLEALVEVEHNPYSTARRVISQKNHRLPGFECEPIYGAGYTYGHYKAIVRADATDGSPPPPTVAVEYPSNTWQDSGSSGSSSRPWRTTPISPWRDERVSNTSPTPISPVNKPWDSWRAPERYSSNTYTGDHRNCTTNANNAVISIKDGHIKIAMDLVFHGTVNVSSFKIDGN